jgi:hypothetical protein
VVVLGSSFSIPVLVCWRLKGLEASGSGAYSGRLIVAVTVGVTFGGVVAAVVASVVSVPVTLSVSARSGACSLSSSLGTVAVCVVVDEDSSSLSTCNGPVAVL